MIIAGIGAKIKRRPLGATLRLYQGRRLSRQDARRALFLGMDDYL